MRQIMPILFVPPSGGIQNLDTLPKLYHSDNLKMTVLHHSTQYLLCNLRLQYSPLLKAKENHTRRVRENRNYRFLTNRVHFCSLRYLNIRHSSHLVTSSSYCQRTGIFSRCIILPIYERKFPGFCMEIDCTFNGGQSVRKLTEMHLIF